LFYLLLIVAGVFLLVLSRGIFGDQARFFKDSYTVPGVVSRLVDKKLMATGTQRQPRIRFDTESGAYEFDAPIRAQAHGLWPGNEVSVNLSPEFPNVAILKRHRHKSMPILIIPAVILIGVGLYNGAEIVDELTDHPMMSIGVLAAIVGLGMGFYGSVWNALNLYYGLHDNIRRESDSLELTSSDDDADLLEGGAAVLEDEPPEAERPEAVALETYGSEYRVLGGVLLVFALPWLIGLFAPWPQKLFGIVIPGGFLALAAFLGLRQRRKYWDPERQAVISGRRWPGKDWHETAQPIRGFVRVEIVLVSSSSSSGSKSRPSGMRITVIHKDDDFMFASGKYSWHVAHYSSQEEKEKAENYASQVAYTLGLPLMNKLE
jgi:hypothetical protein